MFQTIETDTASAAVSFKIDGNTYLAISNTGNVRRYQAKSRIYKVNSSGTLVVVSNKNIICFVCSYFNI